MNNLIYNYPEEFVSVGGLNTYIQTLLEQDKYLRQIWVIGEVSDTPKRYPSGLYFNLQDPENKALISCVIWSSQLPKIAQMPAKGEQLIILGTINLYAQKGQYQLKVWQSLPAGEGLKSIQLRQLKNRLLAEGLFDEERKRKLPIHPQIIAVVTSPQAAAWGDIQKTIN
ncbi:MAG TPA: exodeoxyribonuclease VII large subunit, partial [Allocoleopsis sp.]